MVFLGQAGGKHHLLVATIMQVPLFMAILVIEIISPLHLLLFPIILVFLFLSNIADEYGELYATHFVREVTGMSLRDTEEGCIDLPSHFLKRHFYAQYCYHQGYKVKANAKGSYDSMSEYELRDFDDTLWPPGSEPLAICTWVHFLRIWKTEFPHLKIHNSCDDTYGECVKLKNTFFALDRQLQHAKAQPVESAQSTLDSINEVGPSEDDSSVASSQFSYDGVNDVDAACFAEEDYPVEALVLEASKHALQAQKQRKLASNRISEAKATLDSPWEDRN